MLAIVVVVLFFHLMFFFSLLKKDNSWADVGWGLSFIILCIGLLLTKQKISIAQVLLSSLVLLWGLRLSWHIASRKRGEGEDFRYKQWREQWGKHVLWCSYLQVFLLQCLIMLIVASPIFVVFNSSSSLNSFTLIAALFALFGLIFESLADWQLKAFKRNPKNKGRIIETGLWFYSRHPNYFGEACFWWGLGSMSFASSQSYYALIGPLVITFLLRYVSGVPMLEDKYKSRADFVAYAKKTPAMIPNFFKRK
jgi:steroid 5-alpha reductase family enzyme